MPPTDGYDPAFYASADPADVEVLDGFIALSKWGLRVEPLRGEGTGVGDASALKMSYAVSVPVLNVCRVWYIKLMYYLCRELRRDSQESSPP